MQVHRVVGKGREENISQAMAETLVKMGIICRFDVVVYDHESNLIVHWYRKAAD